MNWEGCLENSIKERKPNPEEAKSLLKMARIRIEDNNDREPTDRNTSLIVESYWEVIKQMTTALLNMEGYKSYSQECLVTFLGEFYDFSESELELMDQVRRLRNDIDYRGEFLDKEYLERNEEEIVRIIGKLDEELEQALKNS